MSSAQKRPVLWRTQPKVISPRTSALKRPPMMLLKKPPCTSFSEQISSENIPKSPEFESCPRKALDFGTSTIINSSSEISHHNETAAAIEDSISAPPLSPPALQQPPFTKFGKPKMVKKVPAASAATCPNSIEAAVPLVKKAPSPQELQAQRKSKIAHYGRKHGSAKAIPEEPSLAPAATTKKRCGWITAQSDAVHIAYHDQEWGVPVHDDKLLFELLTLASAQSELSWSALLGKRENYRAAFSGFDPATISTYSPSKVAEIKSSIDILQQDGKIQSVVDNANRVLQIAQEFGSFDKYIWSFFNHKPIVTGFRMSSQVPVKSSRSELISKDLIRRGFRGVAPAIIYSFMQAAGMTNDHIVHCFRHKECLELSKEKKGFDLSQSICDFGGDYSQNHSHSQVYVF